MVPGYEWVFPLGFVSLSKNGLTKVPLIPSKIASSFLLPARVVKTIGHVIGHVMSNVKRAVLRWCKPRNLFSHRHATAPCPTQPLG